MQRYKRHTAVIVWATLENTCTCKSYDFQSFHSYAVLMISLTVLVFRPALQLVTARIIGIQDQFHLEGPRSFARTFSLARQTWKTRSEGEFYHAEKKEFLYDHVLTTEDYIFIMHITCARKAKKKKKKNLPKIQEVLP